MELTADQLRLGRIFHQHAFEQLTRVQNAGTRFVHYTTADAAMNILKTKEVWMRRTSCMNDFMEVQHGLDCLVAAYDSEIGKKFRSTLEDISEGICSGIEKLFNGWRPKLQYDTYITCLSEHLDSEDKFGRLSMWRAYSGKTGVALVVNNAPFLRPSNALNAYSSPVAYLSDHDFEAEFGKMVRSVEENKSFLREQGAEKITTYVFNMFRFAILCTKHPGFREEKEWRIVYTPALGLSPRITKDIVSVGGMPQPVHKIPLQDVPEEDFIGAEIPELLDRIIIGPTDYASSAADAFIDLLADAGVPDPADRVVVSDIPLR